MNEDSKKAIDLIERRFMSLFRYKDFDIKDEIMTDSKIDEVIEKSKKYCDDIDYGRGNKADELRAVFMRNFYSKIY